MIATVAVAAMGFAATVLAAWLNGRSQRQVDREGRILDAKVRSYGACSESLYEYARATYNRSKTRLQDHSGADHDVARQEAYRANAKARSAIGQVAMLARSQSLAEELARARNEIGTLNDATDLEDLLGRQQRVYEVLTAALTEARSDLME